MSEPNATVTEPAVAVAETEVAQPKKPRKRGLTILLVVFLVFLGVFFYVGRPYSDEMAFLKHFQFTESVQPPQEDGSDIHIYIIKGDPEAIFEAIPGKKPARPSGASVGFTLPSGKHALYVGSPKKQQGMLTVEGYGDPMAVRAMHRLGI